MKNLINLFLIFFISSSVFSQSIPPKREFRAAWIATVINLDWPSSKTLTTLQQQQELIFLLDELKRDGINTVIFQIRSECDAMYSSGLDPWSYWLTGSQGTAPYPYYDPLEFAIAEAHKRGMELHAWFNPYRAERSVGNYTLASNHVTVLHPEWIIQISNFKFLDPGLPDVRNYVTSIITDVVSRYDVDGVHFDDYFYPYPPDNMTANATNNSLDDFTFAMDPRGFYNKYDWRRDNVNILIEQVNNAIQSIKPWVKFGISPFGIWRDGVPSEISGMDAYSVIYCDAIAWLQDQSIDYLTPQLYWQFGGSQDYAKLQPWWADYVAANGRHFYPGHAIYRVDPSCYLCDWPATEIPNQIRFDRANSKVQGGVFFRAKSITANFKGVTDTLKNDLYRFIALNPIMNWKDIVPPNPVQNLSYKRLVNGQAGFLWDLPQTASDGDTSSRYVIYRFDHSSIQPSELDNSENILNIEGSRQSLPVAPPNPTGSYYFVVTAIDRNYNESAMSSVVQVDPPPVPVLAFPINDAVNVKDSVILKWDYPEHASYYRLQISTDSTFSSGVVFDQTGLIDTMKLVTAINGQQKYYWRAMSFNAAGFSSYSNPFSFTTGYPSTPLLAYPANFALNIPVDTTLYWHPVQSASSYSVMLARALDFNTSSVVVNEEGLTDTSFAVSGLTAKTMHYWKVSATNEFGASNWSPIWRFITSSLTNIEDETNTPEEYALEQNYPNPFNPTTKIRVKVSESGVLNLKVYNLLGQEVAILINDFVNPGVYEFEFNASNLPAYRQGLSSGIYLYRISINNFTTSRKMILMK